MDIASIAASTPATDSARAASQLTANFDTFLTLLTTQLQNQDPLEPLDTEQFTQQLVQFAGVEQSIQTNQNLEALIALQTSSANETALAAIGRIATVESDIAALSSDAPARWAVTLPQEAAIATAQVFDARGALVAVLEAPTGAGTQTLIWDGATQSGAPAPAGQYRLEITATDEAGAPLAAAIASRGRVDGVSFNPAGPELEIAGQRFSFERVSRIDAAF